MVTKKALLQLKHYKDYVSLSSICSFTKGQEVGSKNYEEMKGKNLIPYYRVGDMHNKNNSVFVDRNLCNSFCKSNDIIISFDGAPGRLAVGLNGAYSSGMQKISCEENYKGLLFFSLLSDINQKIIKNNSQGTTILHASSSIKYLLVPNIKQSGIEAFYILFRYIVLVEEETDLLLTIKDALLNKYFATNR